VAAEPDTESGQEDDMVLQEAESGIWAFSSPSDMTEDERELLPDIIALDHRSLRQLGHKTRHWTEVHNLIYNTINRFQTTRYRRCAHIIPQSGGCIFALQSSKKSHGVPIGLHSGYWRGSITWTIDLIYINLNGGTERPVDRTQTPYNYRIVLRNWKHNQRVDEIVLHRFAGGNQQIFGICIRLFQRKHPDTTRPKLSRLPTCSPRSRAAGNAA
jgi:hypothetical protein